MMMIKIGGYFDYSDIATEGIFDKFKKNKPAKSHPLSDSDKDLCRKALGVIKTVFRKNAAAIAKKYSIKASAYELILDDDDAECDIDQEDVTCVSFIAYCFNESQVYTSSQMDEAFKSQGQTDGMTGFQELYKILENELHHISPNFSLDLDADTDESFISVSYKA